MQLQGIITVILLVWQLHFLRGSRAWSLSPTPPSPTGKDKFAVRDNGCVLAFACMGLLIRSGDNRLLISSPISVGAGNVRIKCADRTNWTPPDTPAVKGKDAAPGFQAFSNSLFLWDKCGFFCDTMVPMMTCGGDDYGNTCKECREG